MNLFLIGDSIWIDTFEKPEMDAAVRSLQFLKCET